MYDAIILGAGGAGLMAALTAGQAGARVLVLDHAPKAGKKILISGGGRCNFTNMGCNPDAFISQNPHFAKSALSRYTQWDFLALIEKHNIAWHEKTLGQLFCDGSARQVVAMLLDECARGNVEVRLDAKVGDISFKDGLYEVAAEKTPQLVVATGGPSIPKMGATGKAYEIAQRFNVDVVTPKPALVPFTLSDKDQMFKDISGVALPVIARVQNTSFEEAALFTHRGLSGPAILQISSYWTPGDAISLTLIGDAANALKAAKRKTPRAHMKAALIDLVPKRLADVLATKMGIEKELGNVSDADLETAAQMLEGLTFYPSGTEGYAKAEVTSGGINTDELSSKTMEAKNQPGLYFIGEAVDVTGWLGGYNFQWAWSSGVAAGQAIAARTHQS